MNRLCMATRTIARLAGLRGVVLIALLILGVHVCRATSIVSTSGNVIYIDSSSNVSPNLLGSYVSFSVTNDTGSAIADAWVTLGSFTGGFLSLRVNENRVYQFGSNSTGANKTVVLYLKLDSSKFAAGR